MKTILTLAALLTLCVPTLAATCYGDHDCHACKTCEYCAHCNSGAKDKCGVYYAASGLTPPWVHSGKRSAKAARQKHSVHVHHVGRHW